MAGRMVVVPSTASVVVQDRNQPAIRSRHPDHHHPCRPSWDPYRSAAHTRRRAGLHPNPGEFFAAITWYPPASTNPVTGYPKSEALRPESPSPQTTTPHSRELGQASIESCREMNDISHTDRDRALPVFVIPQQTTRPSLKEGYGMIVPAATAGRGRQIREERHIGRIRLSPQQ